MAGCELEAKSSLRYICNVRVGWRQEDNFWPKREDYQEHGRTFMVGIGIPANAAAIALCSCSNPRELKDIKIPS
ncbi:unnamed protein product [Dovyalis caffra]|uniref:Uncharacterized protein n=1 Tax=Dovyalis caffra TaxID=77055 RepID=A0AAV1QTK5_9ROSI|nr:unnamed protein product [Dovyalis caffra]